jgi:hypothetical protein
VVTVDPLAAGSCAADAGAAAPVTSTAAAAAPTSALPAFPTSDDPRSALTVTSTKFRSVVVTMTLETVCVSPAATPGTASET